LIVYEDEASFRQTPTLYRTWARRGQQPQIPTRGERHTQKILGAVSVPTGDFVWRHCHRVYLIQDNASFHKKPEVLKFFTKHRRHVEVFSLPPYSPDFNATERLWHYTRKESTHNRYFDTPAALCQSLFTTFTDMQQNPQKLQGLLAPFF